MTLFKFGTSVGKTLVFNPDIDELHIGAHAAAEVVLSQVGADLLITIGAQTVRLHNMKMQLLTTTNLTFGDGSVLAVGNNSTAPGDGTDNTLDFSTNDHNNLIYGLGGNDTIEVGNGNNIIYGGGFGDDGPNAVDTGAPQTVQANDQIYVHGNGHNVIYGNSGNDYIFFSGTSTDSSVYGGSGFDFIRIWQGTGRAYIVGGDGNDNIQLAQVTNTDSLVSAFSGSATVYGGSAASGATDTRDTIILGTGNSLVFANAGDDTVTAFTRAGKTATVYLGSGNDMFIAGSPEGDGSTVQSGIAGNLVIYTGVGNDELYLAPLLVDIAPSVTGGVFAYEGGALGDVTIYGAGAVSSPLDGNDYIELGAGNSVVYGGGGNDTVSAAPAAGKTDTIYLGGGDDVIGLDARGTNPGFNPSFSGSVAPSNTGTIAAYGNAGNDLFLVRHDLSNYSLFGGVGTDTVQIFGAGGVTANIADSDYLFSHSWSVETLAVDYYPLNPADPPFAVTLGSHAHTAGIVNFDGTRSPIAMTFTSTYAVNVIGTFGDDSIASPGGTLHGMGGKDTFVGGASTTEKYAYDNTGEVRGFISDGNGGYNIVAKADQITQFGLGTGGLAPDVFSFLINQHPDPNDAIHFTSNGFIIGDEDTVIDGFSKVSSVTNTGWAEITVLTTVGVSDANVATTLTILNSGMATGHGALDVIFNSSVNHAQLWFNPVGSAEFDLGLGAPSGHPVLVADLLNVQLADMVNFTIGNFEFT